MADAASTTVIGKDTRIKGELSFDGSARIMGDVEGEITAKGQLEIGEGGHCKAAIDADKVVIDGKVEGDIKARSSLHLNGKADLHGDLAAATLVIAEGATLVGHCRVGPDALKGDGTASVAEAKPSQAASGGAPAGAGAGSGNKAPAKAGAKR